MAITYMYKVISSNHELNVMEVEYSAEGHPTTLVGVPFPEQGTDPAVVFAAFSPVPRWLQAVVVTADVPVGTSGILTYDPAPPPVTPPVPTSVVNQQMWDQVAFDQKVAAALVKFGVLATDPTVIPATVL